MSNTFGSCGPLGKASTLEDLAKQGIEHFTKLASDKDDQNIRTSRLYPVMKSTTGEGYALGPGLVFPVNVQLWDVAEVIGVSSIKADIYGLAYFSDGWTYGKSVTDAINRAVEGKSSEERDRIMHAFHNRLRPSDDPERVSVVSVAMRIRNGDIYMGGYREEVDAEAFVEKAEDAGGRVVDALKTALGS